MLQKNRKITAVFVTVVTFTSAYLLSFKFVDRFAYWSGELEHVVIQENGECPKWLVQDSIRLEKLGVFDEQTLDCHITLVWLNGLNLTHEMVSQRILPTMKLYIVSHKYLDLFKEQNINFVISCLNDEGTKLVQFVIPPEQYLREVY